MSNVTPESRAIVIRPVQPIAFPYGTAPQSQPRVHYSLGSIMQNPLRRFPSVTSLYNNVLPDSALLELPVFRATFGVGKSAKTFTRGEEDPAVCVLNAIGARRVGADALEFLTWNEHVEQPEIFYPFSDESDLFHVYELPARRVAPGKDLHNWSLGIRLGEKTSGARANKVMDKTQPPPPLPPVFRKINWRELVQILKAPFQLGLPSSTNADSKLGWAVYSYMAPEVLLGVCEGSQSLLLRIEGYCSRGHDSSPKEHAQRAKVGLCPCCTRATHVLVPPVYPVGKSDRKKQNSISLWQKHAPFATRNYSAAMYVNANGILPDTWDWVASRYLLHLPPPLNPEDLADPPVEATDENMGLPFGLSQDRPSPLPISGDPALPKKVPKPPPPAHKGAASVSPSPAKSSGSVKGSPSRGGSSWDSDWPSNYTQARDWRPRRWYH